MSERYTSLISKNYLDFYGQETSYFVVQTFERGVRGNEKKKKETLQPRKWLGWVVNVIGEILN